MRSLFRSWDRLLIMLIKRRNGRTVMRRKMTIAVATVIFSAVAYADRLIYEDQIGGWIFSYPTELAVSSDEKRATFGRGPWFGMVDLATGRLLDGIPEDAQFAAFVGSKDTVAFDTGDGWQSDMPGAAAIKSLPSNIIQRWDERGTQVAFFRAGHYFLRHSGWNHLFVGTPEALKTIELNGRIVAVEWLSDRTLAVVLHDFETGMGSLVEVDVPLGQVTTLLAEIDAAANSTSIGVDKARGLIYLSLASDGQPSVEIRHAPNPPDRDLDIYAFNRSNRSLQKIVDSPFDDFSPVVVRTSLYWTRSALETDVVVVPFNGGRARLVAENGAAPYWPPDGKRIAYTIGDNRVIDSAMLYDVAAVKVDTQARVLAPPEMLIVGNHEDFTPAWSPDGRWMLYHTHRCAHPVPHYLHGWGEICRDGLGLLREGAGIDEEIHVTPPTLWEVALADWAPDSRRFILSSWRQGGRPFVSELVLITIDPETGARKNVEWIGTPGDIENARMQYWSPVADIIAVEDWALEDRHRIFLLDLESRETRKIAEFNSSTFTGLDWSPDGGTIVFSGRVDGRYQLFRVSASGGKVEKLTHSMRGNLLMPQVSPDGRWIAATRATTTRQLWHRNLATSTP